METDNVGIYRFWLT